MNKNEQMRYSDRTRTELDFNWPDVPFNIVLVEPEIAPNTGNIARLCAATASTLHLVEPLGFQLTDKNIRRAGLDYWDAVDVHRHPNIESLLQPETGGQKYFFSTTGTTLYTDVQFQPGDYLVFGNESRGLPESLLTEQPAENICAIPIILDHVRSLNLANSASIVLYEALRQVGQAAGTRNSE